MKLLVLLACLGLTVAQRCTPKAEIIKNLDFDKVNVPGGRAKIEVMFWINNIHNVKVQEQTMSMDVYVSEKWHDPKLNFERRNPCDDNVTLGYDSFAKLWTANTVFLNTIKTVIHQSPAPNTFSLVYSNGTVWVNRRMSVTIPCKVEAHKFPFNTITCLIKYESFSYGSKEVEMQWGEQWGTHGVLQLNPGSGINYDQLTTEIDRKTPMYPAGQWEELDLTMKFSRSYCKWFLQQFVPSLLYVLIAWSSLCLGQKSVAARVLLCVGAVLLLTLHANGSDNIDTDVFTAQELWYLCCKILALIPLLEIAVLAIRSNSCDSDSAQGLLTEKTNGGYQPPERRCAVRLDKILSLLLPALFALLTVAFCFGYML